MIPARHEGPRTWKVAPSGSLGATWRILEGWRSLRQAASRLQLVGEVDAPGLWRGGRRRRGRPGQPAGDLCGGQRLTVARHQLAVGRRRRRHPGNPVGGEPSCRRVARPNGRRQQERCRRRRDHGRDEAERHARAPGLLDSLDSHALGHLRLLRPVRIRHPEARCNGMRAPTPVAVTADTGGVCRSSPITGIVDDPVLLAPATHGGGESPHGGGNHHESRRPRHRRRTRDRARRRRAAQRRGLPRCAYRAQR